MGIKIHISFQISVFYVFRSEIAWSCGILNIKPKTIKFLEENIGGSLINISVSSVSDSKDRGNNSKNKQIGLCQTKKLLLNKGNQYKNEKSAY